MDGSTASTVVGTCMLMCPEAEIRFRESKCLIHPLESTDSTVSTTSAKNRRADRQRMVKVYSRPAAGREDIDHSQLRPFPILKETVNYLLRLANESSASWSLVYEFVSDRLRAIRQDMIIQRMGPSDTLNLLEAMIPFYFIAEYRCESRPCPGYDRKLHSTQLEECLSRWKEVFFIVGSSTDIPLCYLLRNADKTETFRDFIEWKTELKPNLRNDIGSAIQAFKMGNFCRFLRIVGRLPTAALRCSAWRHIVSLRLSGLTVISTAFKSPVVKIGVDVLLRWLAFDSEQDATLCLKELGYSISGEGAVCFHHKLQEPKTDLALGHWTRCDDLLALNYDNCFSND